MATAAVERMLEGVDTRARLPDTGAQPQEGSSGHPQGLGGTALEGFPCVGRPLGTVLPALQHKALLCSQAITLKS